MEPHPSEVRRSRHREEARRAILDATEAILVEDGLEQFSIRKLATRCGYTAPTIYHYFRDKDGLIDALLEERFSRLRQRIRRVRPQPDPVDTMRELARAYLRFGLSNPEFYRLMMRGARDGRERSVRAAEDTREIMIAPIRALAAEGRLHSDDVEGVSQSFWALLHGLTALCIGNPKYAFSKNLFQVAVESMLRGIARPLSAPRRPS